MCRDFSAVVWVRWDEEAGQVLYHHTTHCRCGGVTFSVVVRKTKHTQLDATTIWSGKSTVDSADSNCWMHNGLYSCTKYWILLS